MQLAANQREPCDDCGYLITLVRDSGPGIKPELVEKLFKIFGLAEGDATITT